MANGDNPLPREHSLSDVWARVNQQSDQIADLARGSAATEERVRLLGDVVTEGFKDLRGSIEHMAQELHKPQQPTNWFGLATVSALVITGLASFVLLYTAPISVNNQRQDAAIRTLSDKEIEDTYNRGRMDESMARSWERHDFLRLELKEERARIAQLEERTGQIEGQQELIMDRVDGIDTYGSRRWNDIPQGN